VDESNTASWLVVMFLVSSVGLSQPSDLWVDCFCDAH
jgi:hypothetical protein